MSFRDIRKSRKWLSIEEIRLLVFVLIGVVVLLVINIFLASILPGGEWLYMRWSGARAFLFDRLEPYGTVVAQGVQHIVYGRNADPGEYAYVLNDPFFIVLFYLPLAFLPEFVSLFVGSLSPSLYFPIARGVWMLFAEAALIASVVLALRLAEWEPPRWMLIGLIVFSLVSYFSVEALTSGSSSVFLIFLFLATLLALRSVNDELAGALLCLTAYQWEVGGVLFLFILFAVIANRRWSVLSGFAMALFVVLVVSFLTYLGWVLPYVRAVLSDWYRGVNLNLNSYLSIWFPDSRLPIGSIIALALGIIVFFEWVGSVREHFRRIAWTAALSLAVAPLLGFAIFPANHVVMLFPLIMILALVWERWHRRRAWVTALVLLVAFAVPIGLLVANTRTSEPLYWDLLTVLPPVASIIGLYWMRWFAVRSPRTWLDQVGARQ